MAASYQTNTGDVNPLVEATDAVGTCAPHWFEFAVVGADGKGFTVKDTVLETEQPFVALTVTPYVSGATTLLAVGLATVVELRFVAGLHT